MAGVYTIYNIVEDAYSPLDICANDIVAKRRFKQALSQDKIIYKDDFVLYKLADFDIHTAQISNPAKAKICDYSDFSDIENDEVQ